MLMGLICFYLRLHMDYLRVRVLLYVSACVCVKEHGVWVMGGREHGCISVWVERCERVEHVTV